MSLGFRTLTGCALLSLVIGATAMPLTAQAAAPKLAWMVPPFMPRGATVAVVSGDPNRSGPYVMQISMPGGYVFPSHWHYGEEHFVVKSGTFWFAMGDAVDLKAMKAMKTGESGTVPAKAHHYGRAEGATIIEVSAVGPFSITYVPPPAPKKTP